MDTVYSVYDTDCFMYGIKTDKKLYCMTFLNVFLKG